MKSAKNVKRKSAECVFVNKIVFLDIDGVLCFYHQVIAVGNYAGDKNTLVDL